MKLASRVNSFRQKERLSLSETLQNFSQLGLEYVDVNFPEQVQDITPEVLHDLLVKNNLKLNGLEMRFNDKFVNGDLGNADPRLSEDALNLCLQAADFCRAAGGQIVTVWMAHDGFDYSFQVNYSEMLNKIVTAFQKMCDYAPDLKFSLEYKPFQPRAYAFADSLGMDGMLLYEINRKNFGVTLDYCHMLMKHENPAMAADIFAGRKQLFGVHLNDGYGLNDDGLMIATSSPFKTLEFMFYLKKHNYDGVIYFDTFPVVEDSAAECQQNIEMIHQLDQMITEVGIDKIQSIIEQSDPIQIQKLLLSFLNNPK